MDSKKEVIDLLKVINNITSDEAQKIIESNNSNEDFVIQTKDKFKDVIEQVVEKACPEPIKVNSHCKNNCETVNLKISFDVNREQYDSIMKGIRLDRESDELTNLKNNLISTLDSFIDSILKVKPDYAKNTFLEGYNGADKEIQAIAKEASSGFSKLTHRGYVFYYVIESIKSKSFKTNFKLSRVFEMDKNDQIKIGENGEPIMSKDCVKYIDNKMFKKLTSTIMKQHYCEGYTLRMFTIVG